MPNPDPIAATLAQARRRPAPDVQKVNAAETALEKCMARIGKELERDTLSVEELSRLTHALSQAVAAYAKLMDIGEVRHRLFRLEEELERHHKYEVTLDVVQTLINKGENQTGIVFLLETVLKQLARTDPEAALDRFCHLYAKQGNSENAETLIHAAETLEAHGIDASSLRQTAAVYERERQEQEGE